MFLLFWPFPRLTPGGRRRFDWPRMQLALTLWRCSEGTRLTAIVLEDSSGIFSDLPARSSTHAALVCRHGLARTRSWQMCAVCKHIPLSHCCHLVNKGHESLGRTLRIHGTVSWHPANIARSYFCLVHVTLQLISVRGGDHHHTAYSGCLAAVLLLSMLLIRPTWQAYYISLPPHRILPPFPILLHCTSQH
ncbi:hypothetical protein DOTSEDRAFT_75065 [Dothistroma septosporum NZE10]|uniref:Uncharacterized protein n=1 Tax=Dothistroma septosporum (strain NZE10 / CBS 128990) TaxID=675120 RepID=M2XIA3_DOTSN|nr:hypothetical protein DOTSEDRAFT_75065 [Dothistroma septosporum NZE10]